MAQEPTPSSDAKPAPPKRAIPKRAFGRSLSDFPKLSAAEKDLVACCARGKPCVLGDGKRPDAATAANTIRAELIRFLALGGDAAHPVHEDGVMLGGGWITGELSLHQAQAAVQLDLRRCHFDTAPDFTAACLPELVLSGSSVPGLRADRMSVTGGVFLDEGFAATGEVRLLGARIGGNLDCNGSSFANAGGTALSADGITITGAVFLRGRFAATGEVRLLGAQIGGALSCIGGSFINAGKNALSADDMTVASTMFLRKATIEGAVRLPAANIGTLEDDAACWQAGGHILDGLRYDRIIGPTDAKMRIKWLGQQHEDELTTGFAPQPWEQLITVLRAMGHPSEATEVAIAKQNQLRVARWTHKWKARNYINGGLHWLYGRLAGYGHRPLRIVYWMVGVCLAFSLAFYAGRVGGYYGPTSPLIHASPAFDMCGAPGETDAKRTGPRPPAPRRPNIPPFSPSCTRST